MTSNSTVERTSDGTTIRSKPGLSYLMQDRRLYFCNECSEEANIPRYACSECCQYHLCISCGSKSQHEHVLYREDFKPQALIKRLLQFQTTGEILQATFALYAHRFAFGFRDPSQISNGSTSIYGSTSQDSLSTLPPYRWITYEEIGKKVDMIGRGLRQLAEPRSFVGLCSHVQLGWYLADYACQTNSIIGPVIAPTAAVADIVHIINKTGMRLVFVSSATLPRFLAAREFCPNLDYIIQIEDISDKDLHPSLLEARRFVQQFLGKTTTIKSDSILDLHPLAIPPWSASIVQSLDKAGISTIPHRLTADQVQTWRSKIFEAPKPVVLCLYDLEQLGAHLAPPPVVRTPPNELETLVFTSGSTGLPKGAMFSATNWRAQIIGRFATPLIQRTISWTVSDRINDMRGLFYGGAIGIFNGDISRVFEDLGEIRPHQLNATPAFWNKLYAEFMADLKQRTRHLSSKSESAENEPSSSALSEASSSDPSPSSSQSKGGDKTQSTAPRMTKREKMKEIEKIKEELMQEFREMVGGRVETIVTGGAPTSPEVMSFLWDCFSGRIAESYGTTEAGAITTRTQFVHGLQWKLVPWEEYTPDDKPFPRGELCVKREEMMMEGYFGEEDLTKEALDSEGFYRTGDIVELNESHSGAKVIDRKKNIFKLSQGEYVAPGKIEGLIQTVPYVQQVFVYGNSLHDSLVAVIVPHIEALKGHYERHRVSQGLPQLDEDSASLCSLPIIKSFFISEMAQLGISHKLRSFEIPAAVYITLEPFTTENGLQTASEKPSRHGLYKKFKNEIEEMYKSLEKKRSEMKSEVETLIRSELSLPLASSASKGEGQRNGDMGQSVNGMDFSFAQVGGDSLSAVKLRKAIKQKFDVDVPIKVLMDPNTSLESITSFVSEPDRHSAGDAPSGPASTRVNVDAITTLDPTWAPLAITDPSVTGIFLTGATGFLGTAVLCQLLSNTSHRIYCLIRPRNGASLATLLSQRIVSSGLIPGLTSATASDLVHNRVEIITGKLEDPRFGLSSDWEKLNNEVSHIIHAAAYVNSVLPYHLLAPANVEGTRTCIEMCTIGRPKKLIHISTASVVAANISMMDEPLTKAKMHRNIIRIAPGYTSSKYIAEVLVWEAIAHGLDASVIRPGFIGSAATTGFANVSDFDNRLLCGLALHRIAPAFTHDIPFATMPVDYMAAAVLEVCDLEGKNSIPKEVRCFHLEHGTSQLTLSLIVDELKRRGYIESTVTYAEWKQSIKDIAETNPIYTLVEDSFSGSSFPNRLARNSAKDTRKFILSKIGSDCPETDAAFVTKWIDWLEQNGHLLRP